MGYFYTPNIDSGLVFDMAFYLVHPENNDNTLNFIKVSGKYWLKIKVKLLRLSYFVDMFNNGKFTEVEMLDAVYEELGKLDKTINHVGLHVLAEYKGELNEKPI